MKNQQLINQIKFDDTGVFQTMIASGPVIIQKRDGVLKTLLVKHGDKPLAELKWKFCGGRLLKGMKLKDNAVRRAKEEIGVDVKIIGDLPVLELWQEIPEVSEEKPELIFLVHYLGEIKDKPKMSSVHKAMDWFDINDLPEDCAPNVKPVIEDYKQRYL